MIRAFKLEIYPTARQIKKLRRHCIASRILYNLTLGVWQHRKFVSDVFLAHTGKTVGQYNKEQKANNLEPLWKDPSYTDDKFITGNFEWMKELSSCIRRESVKDANDAMKKFFRGLSNFPRYKKRSESFQCRNAQGSTIKLFGENEHAQYVRVPTFGLLKLSRGNYVPIDYKIIQVAFKERAGHWFASISMHLHDSEAKTNAGTIGCDVGCRSLIATQDKQFFLSQDQKDKLDKLERQHLKWKRAMSRRFQKGAKKQSQGFFEAKLKVQQFYLQLLNIRNDAKNKITSRIADNAPDKLVLETLSIKNMQQNKKLSPTLQKAGLYDLQQKIIYKVKDLGTKVYKVPRNFPSTQKCSGCGNIKGRNGTKKQFASKVYKCEICDLTIDRDTNAAINLANASQEILVEVK